MRLALLCPLLVLAACHATPAVSPPPPTPPPLVIIQPESSRAEKRIEKREAKIRDRELLGAAKDAIDRAIKRLDWLNGRDSGT